MTRSQDQATSAPAQTAITTETDTSPQTDTPTQTGSAAQTDAPPFLFPAVSEQPPTWWEKTIFALYQGDNLSPDEAQQIFTKDNPFTSHSEGLEPLLQVLYDQIPAGLVFEPTKNGFLSEYQSWYSPRLKIKLYWRHEELYFGPRAHDPEEVFYWLYMSQDKKPPKCIIHTFVRPGFTDQASTMWVAGKYNQGQYNDTRHLVQSSFALPMSPLASKFKQTFSGADRSTAAAFGDVWNELCGLDVNEDKHLSQFAQDFLFWRLPEWGSEVGILHNWAFVMCHSRPGLLGLAQEWQAETRVDCDVHAVVQGICERAAALINNRIPIGPFALADPAGHRGLCSLQE